MRKLYIFVLLKFPYWLQTSVESFRYVRAHRRNCAVEGFVRQNERRPATVGPGERPYSSAILAMRGTTRQNWEVNGIIHGRKGPVPKCWIGRSNLWWFKNEQIEAEVFNRWMEWWTLCLDQPMVGLISSWYLSLPIRNTLPKYTWWSDGYSYPSSCSCTVSDVSCWTFSTTTWLEKQAVPGARKANVCK